MKKIILFFIVVTIVSCTPVIYYGQSASFVDYSKYDIFLTEANSVSFDYEAIGSVNVCVTSGVDKNKKETAKRENKSMDNIYEDGNRRSDYRVATLSEALYLAVNEAKSKGGNAIIGLQYNSIVSVNGTIKWYVSGMVVKR